MAKYTKRIGFKNEAPAKLVKSKYKRKGYATMLRKASAKETKETGNIFILHYSD